MTQLQMIFANALGFVCVCVCVCVCVRRRVCDDACICICIFGSLLFVALNS